MPKDDHRPQFPFEWTRVPTALEKAQTALSQLIDFTLALSAMCMEREVFTADELFKMEAVMKDARKKLGKDFTMEEGIKAVRAAFRIESRKDWKPK